MMQDLKADISNLFVTAYLYCYNEEELYGREQK